MSSSKGQTKCVCLCIAQFYARIKTSRFASNGSSLRDSLYSRIKMGSSFAKISCVSCVCCCSYISTPLSRNTATPPRNSSGPPPSTTSIRTTKSTPPKSQAGFRRFSYLSPRGLGNAPPAITKNDPPDRVPTELYETGNMQRTIIEGQEVDPALERAGNRIGEFPGLVIAT